MGTKYAILVAMVALAILSGSSMTLARSIPGSSLTLGAFDITNNAGADIDAQCIALAEQGDTWPLGQTTLTSGKNWGLSIQKPPSSIEVYAISCSFSMTGFQDVSQSMWEESNSLYDLPVQCTDCHWTVNKKGFALLNPANGHSIYVAYWGEMRVATPRTTLARSISGSSLTLGAFDITNNAGADIDAQCIALAEQGDTWPLGQTTLTSGKNWGLSIQKPASSIEVYAISCSFSMAGFQDVSQPMWEESNSLYDLPVRCTDCHWTVNKEGFALVNPANGHSIYVAYWGETRVATPRTTLARSVSGSSLTLGAFDITNNAGADIDAQCIALAEQGDTWPLGQTTLTSGKNWGLSIQKPASSIEVYAISCSFSMAGFQDVSQSMWEESNSLYDLPVQCTDCHWTVNKEGFALVNPANGHSTYVAYWDDSRVTTTRTILAQSHPSSSVGHYLGGFDITNNAGIDVVAQCFGVPEKGNIWALGTATVEVGSKWGLGVESPATAISCSFSMAGFLNENLPVWQKNGTPYNPPVNCVDCHWTVDKQGFSVMNDRGQYIFVAHWTPPGF